MIYDIFNWIRMNKKPKLEWKKTNKLQSSIFSDIDEEIEIKSTNSNQSRSLKRKDAQHFKDEGTQFALDEKFNEAISMWNKAIFLNPSDEKLYEMKAQVLMLQEEDFPAVKCAEFAVACNKLWFVGWLTLGRAQLNLRDLKMAKLSFSKAFHLNPSSAECLKELQSAVNILKKIDT